MLADELIDLHEKPRTAPPFTDRQPGLTAAQGYRAAAVLHGRRLAAGWQPVGRKIGFTNRTIWPRYGVYEPGAGLRSVHMSWGHDEYLYHVVKDYLPEPALYMIRILRGASAWFRPLR